MRRLIVVAACLLLAACVTTRSNLAPGLDAKPAANAKLLLVQPDVSLAVLTASGLEEPRADWNQQGRDNLSAELKATLAARSHSFQPFDPGSATEGRAGQLLRLNDAVGQTILAFKYGIFALPTKKGVFDWTLGEGAQALGQSTGADYALFTTAKGNYASGGRVIAAMLIGTTMGSQQVTASLIDLKTGRVVWFNMAVAGPADMRTPEGAKTLVAALLKDAPL